MEDTYEYKVDPGCKFCEAMKFKRQVTEILKKDTPELDERYSVAIVTRTFLKGRPGCRGSSTDYRYRGCGYALNFCPECGRQIKKKEN